MLYDKNVEIWTKGTKTKNSIGQMIRTEPQFLKNLMVDIQPYSNEEAKKEYGFSIECTKRMFCDIEDININTNVIKYKSKSYEITKIIPYDDELPPFDNYMEVMLNEL